jgi:hypothetical protein
MFRFAGGLTFLSLRLGFFKIINLRWGSMWCNDRRLAFAAARIPQLAGPAAAAAADADTGAWTPGVRGLFERNALHSKKGSYTTPSIGEILTLGD